MWWWFAVAMMFSYAYSERKVVKVERGNTVDVHEN